MPDLKSSEIIQKLKSFIQSKNIDIFGITNKIPKDIVFNRKIHGKSIIVIGIHMFDAILDLWIGGKFSKCFSDEILKAYSYQIALFLERLGYRTEPISYNGAYLKDLGVLTGLGKIGKNNLLITPEFGPNIRLRAIITEANLDIESDINLNFNPCIDCDMPCITSCPADAFNRDKQVIERPNDYVMEKCLTYQRNNLKYISENAKLWCIECIQNCKYYK
ncbi:MAG: hypothetical protein GF329_07520 [Candidatus Lokiarchaeota archaeon]|nr:hypothetical protein [Candidatus Lokiarchaeota archaeon]